MQAVENKLEESREESKIPPAGVAHKFNFMLPAKVTLQPKEQVPASNE